MTVIDAAYWGTQATITFGPGLAVAAAVLLLCRGLDRLCDYTAERRQMAELRDAINAAPLIPTQHGHDRAALDTCEAIYQLPARKETP